MGRFVDFAEMKAHCSVEHGLLEDSLPLSGSQVRVEELVQSGCDLGRHALDGMVRQFLAISGK
jgi:hypothetical protein